MLSHARNMRFRFISTFNEISSDRWGQYDSGCVCESDKSS